MPRFARVAPGGVVYHVLNRGNDRRKIFLKRGDASAFLRLIAEAKQQVPMRMLAFCLMNNHWHLSLWPHHDGDLSAFMAWLCNAHVRRWRQHYHTAGEGHLYQGRFKSFPVATDSHLLTVHRYIEANAVRAGLVARAQDWRWGSLWHHLNHNPEGLLDDWPVDRPADWTDRVNQPLAAEQLDALRTSVTRGRPYGGTDWIERMARLLGLEFTLRPRGRPKKPPQDANEEASEEIKAD